MNCLVRSLACLIDENSAVKTRHVQLSSVALSATDFSLQASGSVPVHVCLPILFCRLLVKSKFDDMKWLLDESRDSSKVFLCGRVESPIIIDIEDWNFTGSWLCCCCCFFLLSKLDVRAGKRHGHFLFLTSDSCAGWQENFFQWTRGDLIWLVTNAICDSREWQDQVRV